MEKSNQMENRITGNMLMEFQAKHNLSLPDMSNVFGVGINSIKKELNRGESGIESREICFMLRMFKTNPESLSDEIEIHDFYKAIGGEDRISGPIFSLVLGKEQSAYSRYFESNQSASSRSAKNLIKYAMRIKKVPEEAFNFMMGIAIEEGWSRGFSILSERTWNPSKNKFGQARQLARIKKEKKKALVLNKKRQKHVKED